MLRIRDTLPDTEAWFKEAVPEPTNKNIHTQLGCHFEEVAEMVHTLTANDLKTSLLLLKAHDALHALGNHLKAHDGVVSVASGDQVDLLDALCDQIVTAVGVGYMLKLDVPFALEEVNDSNWSKFVDGKPVFDLNNKIQKGPGYFKANLTPFVPQTSESSEPETATGA